MSRILSDLSFESLKDSISNKTLNFIKKMNYQKMTKIQAESIPYLLNGNDLMASAKTGSGKTLAFLIPVVENLSKLQFKPRNGTGCVIISPTRELSIQTFKVLSELVTDNNLTCALVIGGTNRMEEKKKLASGANIVVATPGRLLDHLEHSNDFIVKNLQCLVIDEADRILEIGFEQEIKKIVALLPKKRQTMLFSATMNAKTEDLAKISLNDSPRYVGVDDGEVEATVSSLQQGYVIISSEKKFLLLLTFLKKNRNKKVMVFMSSCMAVKFYAELLNYIDLAVLAIHGKQKQTKRTKTFFQFGEASKGILLCTDVAARGLDIPAVDWVIQYDPPDDPSDYIHRAGRTARGEAGIGQALLVLRPDEVSFIHYLREARVKLEEFEFADSKLVKIQDQLERLVETNHYLHMSAREAYKSCVRSYVSHSLRNVFNIDKLDLQQVAQSFCFNNPPYIDLDVPVSIKSRPKHMKVAKKAKIYKKVKPTKKFVHS